MLFNKLIVINAAATNEVFIGLCCAHACVGNAFPVSYENLLIGSHLDDFGFDRCRQSSSASSSSLKCQGHTLSPLSVVVVEKVKVRIALYG